MSGDRNRAEVRTLMDVLSPPPLKEAREGAVYRHAGTGAVIAIVDHRMSGEMVTVQLNEAEGHGPGWVSSLWDDAKGWEFERWAR